MREAIMIRVLFQNRQAISQYAGVCGDGIQMSRTREALASLGVQIDFSSDPDVNLAPYDLVHLFNLTTEAVQETLRQALNAKRQNKPIVLSPIYWDLRETEQAGWYGYPGRWRRRWLLAYTHIKTRRLADLLGLVVCAGRRSRNRSAGKLDLMPVQQQVLGLADVLLPNAQAEYRQIEHDFGISKPYEVVTNAVHDLFTEATPDSFVAQYGFRDFVLCVGRIEPGRKNQLQLIHALNRAPLVVVLIGTVNNPACQEYFDVCRALAAPNVHFITKPMSQLELSSAYAAARVHALPSWAETPGLVSLEAALAGCNIVVSDRGTVREYFHDYAWYCDPSDVRSIREAVLEAYETPVRPELARLIRTEYTWDKAAQQTLRGYELALSQAHNNG